ncbi:hypothetical protein CTAYLR_008158 [Chrysophaeum taylorii]|uniref:tRNA uridine 5-carboxymethylaminomethyl modification enzyme C-terminal subdomain domain-containing protein n=1 Tax=Chrysophaeum taylorii TaxID=2483200 RepID=A0AAD7XRX7_9STRA|nr:hypothetical protein CTAYLR_008158 [Chrysophaeum taylorii]
MIGHKEFDVVVIGGGHAGCEAAAAAARVGARTALVTQRKDTIGEMSCNPSIGGIGKGHLVREVDALGGLMGLAIDRGGIHFRMLNRRKGQAVWGPRAQADRDLYKAAIFELVGEIPNLEIIEDSALDVELEGSVVRGVRLGRETLTCSAAVITTGTFLRGRCYVGHESYEAGRHVRNSEIVEPPSNALAKLLEETLGLPLARLKTGTPPRLDGRTIDWDRCVVQPSEEPFAFSSYGPPASNPLIRCHRTATNPRTHEIVVANAHTLAAPSTTGVGPRYCPSLYKKVERFDRPSHGVWLEPEGLGTHVVYPNGLSGAFPLEVQRQIVASIRGLERAEILQAGYDVEYDFVDPRSLDHCLGVRAAPGLYLAGQICGTTGYEEAAALGVIAGANAGLSALGRDRFVLSRRDGYAGVLVDDLVSRGTREPYRMFTSRAEYRLSLRADNADLRLTPRAFEVGLVGDDRAEACARRQRCVDDGLRRLDRLRFRAADWYRHVPFAPDDDRTGKKAARGVVKSAAEMLAMPNADLASVERAANTLSDDDQGGVVAAEARDTVAAVCKYRAYLDRFDKEFDVYRRNEQLFLPPDLDYDPKALPALSAEELEKLRAHRPKTFADASNIAGITPASLVYLYNHVVTRTPPRRRRKQHHNG